jgi:hypothetical protein
MLVTAVLQFVAFAVVVAVTALAFGVLAGRPAGLISVSARAERFFRIVIVVDRFVID